MTERTVTQRRRESRRAERRGIERGPEPLAARLTAEGEERSSRAAPAVLMMGRMDSFDVVASRSQTSSDASFITGQTLVVDGGWVRA